MIYNYAYLLYVEQYRVNIFDLIFNRTSASPLGSLPHTLWMNHLTPEAQAQFKITDASTPSLNTNNLILNDKHTQAQVAICFCSPAGWKPLHKQFISLCMYVQARRNYVPVLGSKINFQQIVKALMFYMSVIFYYVDRSKGLGGAERWRSGRWMEQCWMMAVMR